LRLAAVAVTSLASSHIGAMPWARALPALPGSAGFAV